MVGKNGVTGASPVPVTTGKMAEPKKILFIHHNSVLGGAELSFFDLVTNLSEAIIPICALPAGPLQEKLAAAGIKVHTVPMCPLHRSLNPFYLLAMAIKRKKTGIVLKKICQAEQVDLIHANSLTAAVYSLNPVKSTGLPMIWHERDLKKHPFLTPRIAKFANRIIAISQAVADNLLGQKVPENKIRLIYNGIDIAKFANPIKKTAVSLLPSEGNKVLMAAQFVNWKKHHDFIDMATLVNEENADTFFIFAGDKMRNDQQLYIRALEKSISDKGLDKQFIWTGFVENMPDLLENIDCVLSSSDAEPFGRIVAEAMAAGKPVVAVNSGAIPEIIEDGVSGCLVEPGDVKSMANTVSKILRENDYAQKLGADGKLRISQHFTIQQTVKEFEKLVNEILHELSH